MFGVDLPNEDFDAIISPDLNHAWLWIDNKRAELIDIPRGSVVATFKWPYTLSPPPVAFVAGGKQLVVETGGALLLLDASDGRTLATLSRNAYVRSLAASPTAPIVAGAAGTDIVLWDITTHRQIGQFHMDGSDDDSIFRETGATFLRLRSSDPFAPGRFRRAAVVGIHSHPRAAVA